MACVLVVIEGGSDRFQPPLNESGKFPKAMLRLLSKDVFDFGLQLGLKHKFIHVKQFYLA